MTTKFTQQNNSFMIKDARSLIVHDVLPPAVYVLKHHMEIGFYLDLTEQFELPKKLYGSVAKDSQRVLASFADRPNITGALFTGERGSGKTMLAKKISLDAQKLGMPTIVVNAPYVGDGFNTFIQAIEQDAILFFDEFEKVYDADDQQKMLTLLDGTVMTHKLAIFTSNSKYKVNEHMQNRPGRIFYLKEYDGIDEKFIEEYCMDNLKPELKKHTHIIQQYATMFYAFNFDMLKAIVEEMNRFDETPQEAVQMLNAKPGFSSGPIDYDAIVTMPNGLELAKQEWSGNPLTNGDAAWGYTYWTDDRGRLAATAEQLNDGKEVTREDLQRLKIKRPTIHFDTTHITHIEKNGTIHLETEGFTMTLSKKKVAAWNPSNFLGDYRSSF